MFEKTSFPIFEAPIKTRSQASESQPKVFGMSLGKLSWE